jgi:hypothetical protein
MLATAIALLLPLASPATAFDGQPDAQLIESMVRSDVDNLAANATTDAKAASVHVVPAADTGELSFIDLYFPLVPDDNLHPEIDSNLVVFWIVHVFLGVLAGPLWIPKAITKLEPDDSYQDEALINWIIHAAIFAVGVVTSWAWGLGLVINAVNLIWLFPVATINSFNRHVKGGGGGGKKKGGGKSALSDLPGMPTLASTDAVPSLAY